MSIVVRSARPEDRARCLELLESLLGSRSPGDGDWGDTFERLLTRERGQVHVADEAGALLGMATVSYNLALRYRGEYCQLEELIVDPEARGRNVGALLVQATLDAAKRRGCAEYGLYLVEHTEKNQPFYEKQGLVRVGSEMRVELR